MTRKFQKLEEILSDRLAADLDQFPGEHLPAMRDLCRKYQVSRTTLWKAAHILQKRGLVRFRQGQRMRIVGRSTPSIPRRRNSVETLTDFIREKVVDGTYKSGQPLPKISFFVGESGVSTHTVIHAYRKLAEEKLLYKQGKNWMVGSSLSGSFTVSISSPPVILLLQKEEYDWRSLSGSNRTEKFCGFFHGEAERHGIQVIPVLTDKKNSPGGALIGGRDDVLRMIRELESRYLGILLSGSLAQIPDMDQWIASLTAFRKPVVWFDRYEEILKARPNLKYFSRCHFSEQKPVAAALEFLVNMGHRVVAFPSRVDEWVLERKRLIESQAKALPVSPYVISYPPTTTEGRIWPGYADHVPKELHPVNFSRIKKINAYLAKRIVVQEYGPLLNSLTEWLTPYLSHETLTAVIAPNDYYARQFYYWFNAAGIPIPAQMSLLSFDNYRTLHPLPVTTVDFGFGYLGHCAFHLIFQDLPIKKDKEGNVIAQPQIVHRGSVGLPRKGPLKLDMSHFM